MSHPLDMKGEIEFYRSVAERAERRLRELFSSSGWTEEEFLERGCRVEGKGNTKPFNDRPEILVYLTRYMDAELAG